MSRINSDFQNFPVRGRVEVAKRSAQYYVFLTAPYATLLHRDCQTFDTK